MSDNPGRARYSSAPLHNLRKAERRAKAAPPPRRAPGAPRAEAPMRSFTVLQVMLMIILPVLFLVSLLVQSNMLFLIFCGLSVLCLMAAWLLSAFVPNARATLTIIHIAMVLVALFSVLVSPPKAPAPDQQASVNDLQSIFSKESSASMVDMMQKQQTQAGPAATENPGSASAAQQRLEQFMSAWINIDYTAMASYCVPSWVAAQSSPETSMFHMRSNRSVVSYEVLQVTGNDTDQTRTINMNVVIDKSNGSAPQTHRFQVLMARINDQWYVDPNSLSSLGVIETEPQQAAVMATIIPTATPDPNTTLYYNPDGGRYYHISPNCTSLKPEYLPLTHSFLSGQRGEAPYSSLIPCATCGAP